MKSSSEILSTYKISLSSSLEKHLIPLTILDYNGKDKCLLMEITFTLTK